MGIRPVLSPAQGLPQPGPPSPALCPPQPPRREHSPALLPQPQPPEGRDPRVRCRPAATVGAQPRVRCSITLMTQLIVISFAINLDVKRNSTHLLLINTPYNKAGSWQGSVRGVSFSIREGRAVGVGSYSWDKRRLLRGSREASQPPQCPPHARHHLPAPTTNPPALFRPS